MTQVIAVELNQVAAVQAGRINLNQPLTILGGGNNEGKTGTLNAILAALCGQKYVPSRIVHEDKETGMVRIQIQDGNNNLWVEKTFRTDGKPILKLRTPQGTIRSGQSTLDKLFDPIALDARPFFAMDESSKAEALLQNAGINTTEIDRQIDIAFDNRKWWNRQLDDAETQFATCKYDPDYPEVFPKVDDIVAKLEDARKHNRQLDDLKVRQKNGHKFIADLETRIEELKNELAKQESKLETARDKLEYITDEVQEFELVDTKQYEQVLANNGTVQTKVQANREYRERETTRDEAYAEQQKSEAHLEGLRKKRTDMLTSSKLPDEVSIGQDQKGRNVLLYKGDRWDTMSASDQYFLALEQARLRKPECSLVLVDGLECMDDEKLNAYRDFIKTNNLQVLATRVTQNNNDCDLLVEEGHFLENGKRQDFNPDPPTVSNRKKTQNKGG